MRVRINRWVQCVVFRCLWEKTDDTHTNGHITMNSCGARAEVRGVGLHVIKIAPFFFSISLILKNDTKWLRRLWITKSHQKPQCKRFITDIERQKNLASLTSVYRLLILFLHFISSLPKFPIWIREYRINQMLPLCYELFDFYVFQ